MKKQTKTPPRRMTKAQRLSFRIWFWKGSRKPKPPEPVIVKFVARGLGAFGDYSPPPVNGHSLPLRAEASLDHLAKVADRATPAQQDFPSLIELYQMGAVLVARDSSTGSYRRVKLEKKATHRLVPVWGDPQDDDNRALWKTGEQVLIAVTAEPLRINPGRPDIEIKRPFPRRGNVPVYRRDATVEGKRAVLHFIVKKVGAAINPRSIRKLDEDSCDALYDDLIRASREFRIKHPPRVPAFILAKKGGNRK